MKEVVVMRVVFGAVLCSVLVALMPSVARAQLFGQMFHVLEWTEVNALTNAPVANPNGILEPGEAARLIVSVSFTPPVGSVVQDPITLPGGATVRGFHSTIFGINPTNIEEAGSWYGFSSPAPFTNHYTTQHYPFIFGSVVQESQGGAWVPDPLNPIAGIWEAVWRPDSYEQREVEIRLESLAHTQSTIWGQTGVDPQTGHPTWTTIPLQRRVAGASVNIPIIPAPGTLAIAAACIVVLRRRRR
jgi:hypothetical protein